MNATPLTLLAIQALGLAVVLFGDIGFAVPGRFGLDFSHFLIIAAAEVGLLIALTAWSIARRKWWPATWSLIIVSGGAALVLTFL
jgi:hypothetical protein